MGISTIIYSLDMKYFYRGNYRGLGNTNTKRDCQEYVTRSGMRDPNDSYYTPDRAIISTRSLTLPRQARNLSRREDSEEKGITDCKQNFLPFSLESQIQNTPYRLKHTNSLPRQSINEEWMKLSVQNVQNFVTQVVSIFPYSFY